jgi:hypothetical protein
MMLQVTTPMMKHMTHYESFISSLCWIDCPCPRQKDFLRVLWVVMLFLGNHVKKVPHLLEVLQHLKEL